MNKSKFQRFEKYPDFTLDIFWKEVFYGCSQGNFPKGAWYDDREKSVKIRNDDHVHSVFLNDDDEFGNFNLLKVEFMKRLFIHSENESKKNIEKHIMEQTKKLSEQFSITCWKKIKNKDMKSFMLSTYVEAMKPIYKISSKDIAKMKVQLTKAISDKAIMSEDIVIENSQIVQINNLHFDEKEKSFVFKHKEISLSKKSKNITKISYVDTFLKRIGVKIEDYFSE